VEVGAVATALHRSGRRAALVGLREWWQLAAGMDDRGHVDLATEEASLPAVAGALGKADLVVVNGQACGSPPELARLIEAVSDDLRARPGSLLIVLGLAPGKAPFVGLAPIVVRGQGFGPGLVTSATTRRAGLVANIDLAPTMLQHLEAPLPASLRNGSAIVTEARGRFVLARAVELDVKGQQADAFRYWGLPVFWAFQAALVPLLLFGRLPGKPRLQAGLFAALMGLPVATYFVAAAPAHWPTPALLAVTALLALGGGVALLPAHRTPGHMAKRIAAVAALTLAVGLGEVLIGAPLHPRMLLGYALGFGGRFYGIANEPAGLLIAAAVLTLGALPMLRALRSVGAPVRGLLIAVVVAATVGVLAAPQLGAKAGCTAASVVSLGAWFLLTSRARHRWVLALLVLGLAIGVVMLAGHLDAARGPEHATHIGRAWLRLTAEGPAFLAELVRRKATTVWNTMRLIPWLFGMLAWVLIWTIGLLRPAGVVRRVYDRVPALRAAFQAVAVGGIAAALLTDSGVQVPAMMLTLALPALALASLATEPEGVPVACPPMPSSD
jgi:hypothetical protein